MNVLEWRRDEVSVCLSVFLPRILEWFAERCKDKLKTWRLRPISVQHSSYGFHFTNVVLVECETEGGQHFSFKLPIPNEDDVFIVNDVAWILVNELTDQLVSYRYIPEDKLLMRWQGSLFAVVGDENGVLKIRDEKVPIWVLLYNVFSKDELIQNDLYFEFVEVDKAVTRFVHPLISQPSLGVQLSTRYEFLTPLQQLIVNSMIRAPLRSKSKLKQIPKLSTTTIEFIENELLDPITREIYDVRTIKDLLYFMMKVTEGKSKTTLTGSNLYFKRVRSYETVMIALYEKLRENQQQQKYQKKVKIASDFLLKRLFTSPQLQRLFEYFDQTNMFKEISLRYKVVVPLEYIPYDMRDVHYTMSGNICVYDTPDDEGIGAKLQFAVDCELQRYGFFVLKERESVGGR